MRVDGKELSVFVNGDGTLQFVHDDDLAVLFREDDPAITRASHVEPSPGGWTADLSPVGGPVLGPYERRDQALAAETAWLEQTLVTKELATRGS